MFLDEARARRDAAPLERRAGLRHRRRSTGSYFFAMEFLHGAGRAPAHEARARARQHAAAARARARRSPSASLAGLHYAHEQRRSTGGRSASCTATSRRSNVARHLRRRRQAARLRHRQAREPADGRRADGTLKGKIAYMSPEQCRGDALDRRSDVFAAAILLVGAHGRAAPVRRAQSTSRSCARSTRTTRRGRRRSWRDYPPALEEIVMRGLAREREAALRDGRGAAGRRSRRSRASGGWRCRRCRSGAFVRELFRGELEAWQAAERAGQPGEPVVQTTPSGNLIRTETSISGPVPPMLAAHTESVAVAAGRPAARPRIVVARSRWCSACSRAR